MRLTKNKNVLIVEFDLDNQADEQAFLLQSDVHYDSKHCDRALVRRHLEQAVEQDAGVLIFGDLFDLMQGKFDKRASMPSLDPEILNRTSPLKGYIDACVEFIAEAYEPVADRLLMVGEGNHETMTMKRHDTNTSERICERLRTQNDSPVKCMPYAGWVLFRVTVNGTKRGRKLLRYTHGTGGSAEVSLGTIGEHRKRTVYQADLYVSGHDHVAPRAIPHYKISVSRNGDLKREICYDIKTGTYKRYPHGSSWEEEKGFLPKPPGAVWLYVGWDNKNERPSLRVVPDVVS